MEVLRLGELLKQRGITHVDFADRVGLSKVYISEIVRNVKFPRKETLVDIAKALDVDIRELFYPTKETGTAKEALEKIREISDQALGEMG